jgi:hypothetical protein
MVYRVCGYLYGILMAMHFYVILVFLPAIIETYFGDDE